MLDRTQNPLTPHGRMSLVALIYLMAETCNARVTDHALVDEGKGATLAIVFETTEGVDHDCLRALISGTLYDSVLQIYDLSRKDNPSTLTIDPQFP
ncbi:hypothetical protein HOI83_00830 [Candidatus Uhrbacteria bacterium]|jgi:hypothetical protein|nr:hypothetical protein [Candidatus Uhrbacteria bacterium]